MANKIVLKKSSVNGRVPSTSDLDYGELALNYTDGKLYFKNSSNVINAFKVNNDLSTVLDRKLYTVSSAGTNTFAVDYEVGFVDVFVNGVKLNSSEFTATDGLNVTITALVVGDEVQLTGFRSFTYGDISTRYIRQTYTATAGQTTFNIEYSLSNGGATAYVQVFVNGVLLDTSEYTASSGTAIVLATAASAGDIVECIGLNDFQIFDLLTSGTGLSYDNNTGTITLNSATAATANTVALRDGSGNLTANTFNGALSGNATTATTLQTARTINGQSFNGSANISFGTDSVSEGSTNLYFTEARARTALSGTSPSLDTVTLTGELRGPASFVIDPSAVGDNTGVVIIKGDLQVDGTTTTINSTTLSVDDKNIVLASGAANAAAADGAGITIDGANATLTYASSPDLFVSNKALRITDSTNTLQMGQWDGSNNRIESVGRSLFLTTYDGSVQLGIDGTADVTITADRKVGIGTSTPNQAFTVIGRANFDAQNNYYGAWIDGNTTGNSWFAVGQWYNVGGRVEAGGSDMHIYTHNAAHNLSLQNQGGKVGVGTYQPTHTLDVRGDLVVKGNSSSQHSVIRFRRSDSLTDFGYIGFESPNDGNSNFLITSVGNGNPLKLQSGATDPISFYQATVGIAEFTSSISAKTDEAGLQMYNGNGIGFDESGTRTHILYPSSGYLTLGSGDGYGGLAMGNSTSIRFDAAASSDLFVDVEPGTRTLRTRNWNTASPNISATAIKSGTFISQTEKNTAGVVIEQVSQYNAYNDSLYLDFRMYNETVELQKTGNPAARLGAYLEGSNNGYGLDIYTRSDAATLNKVARFNRDGQLIIGPATTRPTTIQSGAIYLRGESGGWSLPYGFKTAAGTYVGGFGMYGNNNSVNNFWVGPDYNNNYMTWDSSAVKSNRPHVSQNGYHWLQKELPQFYFGAGGITDEYLVLAKIYDGGATIASSGVMGEIISARGSQSTGNSSTKTRFHITSAYNNNRCNEFTITGERNFFRIDIITIDGVKYYAAKAATGGGEQHLGISFSGWIITDNASNLLTKVRSSDANVTVVTTGAFWPAMASNASDNNLYLECNNNTVMTLRSDNKVGIGTTGGYQKLDVKGGALFGTYADTGNGLTIKSESSSSHWNWRISTQDVIDGGFEIARSTTAGASTFNNPSFAINGSGNVAIGTNTFINGGNASKWLTINGSGSNYTGGIAYTLDDVVKGYTYHQGNYMVYQATSGSGHRFYTNTSTIALTIDSGLLDVNGAGRFLSNAESRGLYIRANATDSGNIIQFENADGSQLWEIVGRGYGAGNPFYIYKTSGTGAGIKYTISSDGNHIFNGNATVSGQIIVPVGNGGSGYDGIRIQGTGNYESLGLGTVGGYGGMIRSYGNDLNYYAGHWRTSGATASEDHSHYWYTSRNGSSDWSTWKMRLDHNGSLSIANHLRIDNSSADGAQLVLASSGYSDWNIDNYSSTLRFYYGSTVNMSLSSGGNLLVNGTITESSTRRIKENIRPITNALEVVNKLQGVIYDKIDGSQKDEPGLIAEDTLDAIANLVVFDDDGQPAGVKYTKTVAYLIEAVKELTAKVNALENK